MEIESEKWLTELDLDEFIFIQRFQQSRSFESYSSYPPMASGSSIETGSPALDSTPVKDEAVSHMGAVKSQPLVYSKADKRNHSMINTSSDVQAHILKERRRRQQLNQQFIALSSLVPGLQKMDKNTVLGDVIEYLKHLKERVKELEGETRKRSVESVLSVKKFLLFDEEEDSSSSNESSTLPEIEARVSENDVLIRIHCRKQQGIVAKIIDEIEKLHLSIVNSTVLPFGNSTLVITIIGQMNSEFFTTVKDLVTSLRLFLANFTWEDQFDL